jgi:hypothetical protein
MAVNDDLLSSCDIDLFFNHSYPHLFLFANNTLIYNSDVYINTNFRKILGDFIDKINEYELKLTLNEDTCSTNDNILNAHDYDEIKELVANKYKKLIKEHTKQIRERLNVKKN